MGAGFVARICARPVCVPVGRSEARRPDALLPRGADAAANGRRVMEQEGAAANGRRVVRALGRGGFLE